MLSLILTNTKHIIRLPTNHHVCLGWPCVVGCVYMWEGEQASGRMCHDNKGIRSFYLYSINPFLLLVCSQKYSVSLSDLCNPIGSWGAKYFPQESVQTKTELKKENIGHTVHVPGGQKPNPNTAKWSFSRTCDQTLDKAGCRKYANVLLSLFHLFFLRLPLFHSIHFHE